MKFNTPAQSIAHKTVIGAGWMILWRAATRLLGFVSTLILAHILVPADFGLLAIASTYVAAFDTLSQLGLQGAIIRSDVTDDSLFDAAFTIGAIRGLGTGVLVACSAPWGARFFYEPRLTTILLILAVLAVVEGLENIGVVEFQRKLRFKMEFLLFLLPRLVSVATTITCAIVLRSYWALIIGVAAHRISRLLLTYVMHPYRPRLNLVGWRRLFSFSLWSWITAFAAFARDRSWAIILGRLFNSFSVGVFMLGFEIAILPTSEVVLPIGRALYSGFAAARKEGSNLGDIFARSLAVVAVPVLPAAIGISAIAGYIVYLALGPKWLAAVTIIQWLAVSAPLTVLSHIGSITLIVVGQMRNNFFVVAFGAIFGTLACLLMAWRFGLPGAAVSVAIFTALEGLIFWIVTARSIGAGIMDCARRLVRPIAATSVMAAVLSATGYGWADVSPQIGNAVIDCACATLIGAGSYIAALSLLWILAGRPDGSETFLFGYLRSSVRRARAS